MDPKNRDIETLASLLTLTNEEIEEHYNEKLCTNKEEDDMTIISETDSEPENMTSKGHMKPISLSIPYQEGTSDPHRGERNRQRTE